MSTEPFFEARESISKIRKNAKNEGYMKKYDKYKQQSAFIDYSDDTTRSSLSEEERQAVLSRKARHTVVFGALDLFIVNNIPNDYVKQFPLKYSIYFGLCAYFLSIFTLSYFTISGYLQITKEQFISLDKNAGNRVIHKK